MRIGRTLALWIAGTLLVACGSNGAATQPSTAASAAPIVRIVFEGPSQCAPLPGKPCTLSLVATIQSLDRDSLTYGWSGCAAGTTERAICTVDRPGPVTASIEVRDSRGGSARHSLITEGTNSAPAATLTGIVWESDGAFELFGSLSDPEEGNLCGGGGGLAAPCPYVDSATATGDCRPNVTVQCSCLAGLDVMALKTASRGSCVLTFNVKDSWGLAGTASATISFPR